MRGHLTEKAKEWLYNLLCIALFLLATWLLRDIWLDLLFVGGR